MLIWLFNIVGWILAAYAYVLIATAILSWIPDLQGTQIGQLLNRLSEPYLRIFRRFIPTLNLGGFAIDVSFIVALIVYYFIRQGIMSVLYAVLVRMVG